MACKFVIIGANESPVFEMELGAQPQDMPHLADFILHSSLDLVEDARWKTKEMFLKKVDSYEKYSVVAWVTASNAKFLLLTERADVEGARQFFTDVHELYLKVLMNPFYIPGTRITTPGFEARVRKLAQRHIG